MTEEFSIPANSTVNMDFQTAVVSRSGAIYFAYVDNDLNARIAKKDKDGVITTAIVATNIFPDAHRAPSIGLDAEGYIHWAGDNHNTAIRYFRSTRPEDITSFTELNGDTSRGGLFGPNGVSYGRFIVSRVGTLMFISRQRVGTVNDGWVPGIQCGHIQVYNTDTKRWTQRGGLNYAFTSDKGQTISGGMDAQHQVRAVFWDNSGAGAPPNNGYQGYKIRVIFDKNNRMHMAWTVAKNPVYSRANNDVANAHTHLMYAYSDDEGLTWRRSDGVGGNLTLPITTETGELIYMEDPNVNSIRMFNGAFVTTDAANRACVMAWSGSNNRMMVFRNTAPGIWADGSFTWNNGWPGEAATDDNGWITILSQPRWRRSSDNGNSFQQYERDNSYRNHAGQSIDYEYLYETGQLRFKTETSTDQTVRTILFSGSAEGQVMQPVITPASGTQFTGASQTVTITSQTAGATIRYTTDGSMPTETNGLVYTAPFTVSATTTVKARAFVTNRVASRLAASQVLKFTPDNTPPSVPAGLAVSDLKATGFVLQWNASSDNVAVAGYEIYRNSVLAGTSGTTSLALTGLSPLTTYQMQVRAYDAQGNYSALSTPLAVTTPSNEANIGLNTGSIVIDGNKEPAWYGQVYDMDIVNAGSVSSTADLWGNWTALYDQDFLYFFVDVNDDELSANRPNWYENDGIEIYIDAINRKGNSYQSTDFQFNYMIGDNQLRERSRSASTAGCELVRVNKTGGYRVEVKIPWSVLGITAPAQGYKIGLDLMLIDNDGGNWQGKRAWFNTADNSWNNPSAFGVANFGGTLPLTLLRFQARPSDQAVQLEWVTASEENFRGFELYRSTDGRRYEQVGSLIPGGRSKYSYADRELPAVRNLFYKLRMIDLDGSARWSPVVAVPLQAGNVIFQVMPNPATARATVIWSGIEGVKALRLLDGSGKLLSVFPAENTNNLGFDVQRFSKGMYWIQAVDASGQLLHTGKLVIE